MEWTRIGLRRQGGLTKERRVALGRSARRTLGLAALALAAVSLAAPARADITLDTGHGPVNVRVPADYDGSQALPLVMLLHPLGTSGELTETYFHGLTSLAESQDFFLMAPDAPESWLGLRYWHVMPWETEDSIYLKTLLDAAVSQLNVAPGGIAVIGHSMGAVMGYRLASDYPGTVSAVVSLSGGMVNPLVGFAPQAPVHVLEIHGTADEIVPYEGNWFTQGARASVMQWVGAAQCGELEELVPEPMDMDFLLFGDETDVSRWSSGCNPNGSAELWTMRGAGHVPFPTADMSIEIVRWLQSRWNAPKGRRSFR